MDATTATPAQIDGRIAELDHEEAQLLARLKRVRAELALLDNEFESRGGWTRAYLVNNIDGHVHHGIHCSTLRYNTDLRWLTQYSGKTQDEIIAAAGWRACTVCYPDAPLGDRNTLPSTITTDDEAAAADRAAEKAAKAAEKATKEVRDTNGEAAYKTERAAELAATEALADIHEYPSNRAEYIAKAKHVIALLTAKRGEDPTAALIARAADRIIRQTKEYNRSNVATHHGKMTVPAKADLIEAISQHL